VQVRAIQAAIHGKPAGGATAARPAVAAEAPKICVGPPPPDTSKQVSVTVARAPTGESMPASEPAEFRRDTPLGYERGYVVEGLRVHESYRVDTSCTTATATVGALTLQVRSVLLSPDSLESWVKQVDLKALASAAARGDTEAEQQKLAASFPTPPRGWQIVPPTTAPPLAGALAYQVYEQGLF